MLSRRPFKNYELKRSSKWLASRNRRGEKKRSASTGSNTNYAASLGEVMLQEEELREKLDVACCTADCALGFLPSSKYFLGACWRSKKICEVTVPSVVDDK